MNSSKTTCKKIVFARVTILAVSIGLLIVGINGGDYIAVMNKAIRICYECIGIG
ncbi:MAG: hypothetical protein K6G76_11170 [Lachnospiraceae bacterium]|nr:hypothetical protein [Lachnospiraceae bacterium]